MMNKKQWEELNSTPQSDAPSTSTAGATEPRSPLGYSALAEVKRLREINAELLAALENIQKWLSDGLPLGRRQKLELATRARAAIQKATNG